uniref:P-loop containing nucleoside triphosphate hydrolase protein n=1 Tax=Bionectria ochroleuca TaxID=29856 RepID=A0A8H7K177_BIOOC
MATNMQIFIEKARLPRELWQHRLAIFSGFLRLGNVHLLLVASSLISLTAIYLLRTPWTSYCVVSKPAKIPVSQPPVSPAYAIGQSVASAVAFSLLLICGLHEGVWQKPASVGYIFILGLVQFAFRPFSRIRTNVSHQINQVALGILILEAAEVLLPLGIIGSHLGISSIGLAKLISLASIVLIALITPRCVKQQLATVEDASIPTEPEASPEETCSWFSYYLSYGWLTNLILRGAFRDLCLADLPSLPSYDAPTRLLQRISVVRLKGSRTFYSLCKTFRCEISEILTWAVLTAMVEYVAALAMFNLLAYLENPNSTALVVHPGVWISLLFIGPMTRSVCYQQSIFKSTRLMVLWRATVLQEIYQKMLRSRVEESIHMSDEDYRSGAPDVPQEEEPIDSPMSNSVKTESLVSYDADMISNSSDLFYALTASLVSTAVAMTFLYQLLGWPSLVGIGVMAILTPLPAIFSQRMSRLHRYVMEATDLRLSRLSEYLHALPTIKYFAWEPMVVDNINTIRQTEQQRIWKRNVTSMLVSMTGDLMSLVSLLAMFVSLVLFTNTPLRAPMAFTSVAITETLRSQFVWLCKVIQWVSQARGSLIRVDSFLEAAAERQRHPHGPPELQHATVRWSEHASFMLRDISVSFRLAALNVVSGGTGSGKSLLLLSLLGETNLTNGLITCPDDVAYVPQTAWLQNTSVRQNIIFYSDFDQERYNSVLHACDLSDDLSRLPLGDLTQVGERGSALSGGQKQRISLARALYSSASTLLLDDIFSALDAHTTSRVYILKYMLLFGGAAHASLALCSALVVQLAYLSITLWLSVWTNARDGKADRFPGQRFYLYVYTGTVVGFILLQFWNNFIFQRGGWHASRTMHQRLVNAVVKAPNSWLSSVSIGQILSRFGPDTQSIDAVLTDWLRMTLDNGLRFVLRLASIASIMPIFALPAGLFCLIGFATGEMYSRAEISVKRIVSIKFAPIFSHFNETTAGMAVIRAQRSMDGVFQQLLADKIAQHMRAAEAQFNCNRWVSIRSDFCAATIAATAGYIAYSKSGSAGLVGFSLTNAIGLSQTILTLIRNMNELEVELNSFQRIHDYTKIEPEETAETEALLVKNKILAAWPTCGRVEIRNLRVRYAPDQVDVLQDINIDAKPGERIAIVGRTGSGKSTLGLSMLRSTYISAGQILIDGVDITKVPLRRLRKAIGLIPQETVLFSGDAQSNLDPFSEVDRSELEYVLQACSLPQEGGVMENTNGAVPKAQLATDTPIASGGTNFSTGQRQIFGLARAMCRRSKVIIMDEATASVDHKTDARMQRLVRSEFVGSTIIAIAHRLRTVVDYDRVIVMGEGRVVEMGTPSELLKSRGAFWEMLKHTGEYDELRKLIKL